MSHAIDADALVSTLAQNDRHRSCSSGGIHAPVLSSLSVKEGLTMRARGAVSLVVLLLSWLALDDITTDNANEFPLEYALLVSAGIWFTALGVSLVVTRHVFGGVSSLVAVGLGVVAFWSLPHHYQPPSPINYLGYVPLAWFAGLTVWLLAARVQAKSG